MVVICTKEVGDISMPFNFSLFCCGRMVPIGCVFLICRRLPYFVYHFCHVSFSVCPCSTIHGPWDEAAVNLSEL